MIELSEFFRARRDQLVDQAIEQAKLLGYAPYTTTLRAAWEEAIDAISEALFDYLKSNPSASIDADLNCAELPYFEKLRRIANMHRSIGITLHMYIGLFKMFRELYLDIYSQGTKSNEINPPASIRPMHTKVLRSFFDAAEISSLSVWSETSEPQRLREMQSKAHAATLEKDQYLTVFESLRDPAFLIDRNGALLNANQMAKALFVGQASPGDVYYFDADRHEAFKDIINTACSTKSKLFKGASLSAEFDIPDSLDSDAAIWLNTRLGQRCFDISEREIQDACDNNQAGCVLIMHDVTNHRDALVKATRAERAKSDFLATMSHEIRTPMHGLLGAIELLSSAKRSDQQMYMSTIETAGRYILETFNRVLEYSQLHSGTFKGTPTQQNLSAFVADYSQFANAWAQRAERLLIVEQKNTIGRSTCFDATAVRQILNNLLSNAINYGVGTITLRIYLESERRPEPELSFEIMDQGRSLDLFEQDTLFEPFVRQEGQKTGTGLGLSISKLLAHAMSGSLDAFNEPETGNTVFRLSLPLSQGAGSARETSGLNEEDARLSLSGSCLVLDDDHVSASVTVKQLEKIGVRAELMLSAKELEERLHALQRDAHSPPWQYCLIDYQLPNSNGALISSQLRKVFGEQCPSIIALTANAHLVHSDEMLLFDRIITKPASIRDIGDALQQSKKTALLASVTNGTHPLIGLSADAVTTVLQTFNAHWQTQLPEFLARLSTFEDRHEIASQAHHLAGSCAAVGLKELSSELKNLETEIRNCERERRALMFDNLDTLPARMSNAPARARVQILELLQPHEPCHA